MLKRLVEYCSNSSIHGLHYITDPKRHISERVFWAVVCITCLFGSCIVLKSNVYNFQNNAVSFVMETTYLDWNTTFPAISVCESESSDKLFDTGNRIYGETRNMNLDFYLRDIAFYFGTCYTCSAHCGKTINCSQDLEEIVDQVRAPCKDLIKNCQFNGKPFRCCRYFRRLGTENGPCYVINSMHLPNQKKLSLDMTSNRETGPGKLEFLALENVKVILHAPEDVPYLNHPQQQKEIVLWGSTLSMRFKIKEIENDPYVKDVSISQRNCRFPSENYLQSHRLYSYSACVVECRAVAQYHYCGCIHHFMPPIDGFPMCNLTGLECLSKMAETLRSLRTADYTEKLGLVCDCLPSCSEPEYDVVSTITGLMEYNETIDGDFGSKIVILLDSLPKEQFKRKVVRSSLELVVSMGGTIGFFLGASLLSIAELFYYFFIRRMVKIKQNVEFKGRVNEVIAQLVVKNEKRTVKNKSKLKLKPFSD